MGETTMNKWIYLTLLCGPNVPIFALVVYFASRAARVAIPALQPAWPYLVGYLAFLGLVYGCYFTGTTGQTVGKMAAGLRVVDAAGHPPGYVRAFVRAAFGACGVLAAGLGLLPMMFDPARRAFYEFHDSLMEPWDGPASVCFTDGTVIGAVLDRNGLRPSRIWVTDDGLVVMASEAGVLPLDPSTVVQKLRLQPGRMFRLNLKTFRWSGVVSWPDELGGAVSTIARGGAAFLGTSEGNVLRVRRR
jgi:hypothetical protein